MSPFPSTWVIGRLDEMSEIQMGRQRSPRNATGEFMRPYLRAANVRWDGLQLDNVLEMNFPPDEFERFRLERGDIVVVEASGSADQVGRPAIWRGEIENCCFQNHLIRVRPRYHTTEFLFYFLMHEALGGSFGEAAAGVGINHLGSRRLAGWQVPLPPLEEQNRIVEAIEFHMSRLNAGLESLKRAARSIEAFRSASLDLLFDDPAIEWVTMKEVAQVEAKLVAPAEHPDLPHIAPNHIESRTGRLLEYRSVREDGVTSGKYKFKPGDVVYSKIRPYLAKAAMVDFEGLCSADAYPLTPRVDQRFLHLWLISPRFTALASRQQGRSVLPKINREALFRLPAPQASNEDQARLVETFDRTGSILGALGNETWRATLRAGQLRRSVLAAAFSGRLIVSGGAAA
jgi:type I restriction enzyme S subunit